MRSARIDIILFSVTAFLAAILILFGLFAYPPPNGDSLPFITPAISFARGDGLISAVWKYIPALDETGARRFLNHGPYYPLLIGALSPRADVYGALFAVRFVDTVVLFLGAITGRVFLRKLNAWNWAGCLLLLLTLGGFCTHLAWSLRPERMALLVYVLLGLVLLVERLKPLMKILLCAVLQGFCGTVHPFAALMLSAMSVMFFSTYLNRAELLRVIALYVGVSAVTFIVLMAISPHGLVASLAGQKRMAQLLVVEGREGQAWEFLFHFVTHPRVFLFGVVLVGGCVAGFKLLRQFRSRVASPAMFYLGLTMLVFLVYYFVLRKPSTAYNLMPPYPYLAAMIMYQAATRMSFSGRVIVPGAILSSNVIAFLRWVVLFPFVLKSGVSLEDARNRFEKLSLEAQGKIGGTNIVWTFTERYDRLFDYPSEIPTNQEMEDRSYLIVQQFAYGSGNADPIPHHHLLENRFRSQSVQFLGINLGNRMPDYAYAIYAPDKPAEKP